MHAPPAQFVEQHSAIAPQLSPSVLQVALPPSGAHAPPWQTPEQH